MPIDPAIQSAQASQLAQLLKACTDTQGSWSPEDYPAMIDAELDTPLRINSKVESEPPTVPRPSLRTLLRSDPAPLDMLYLALAYYQACEQHPESHIPEQVAFEIASLLQQRISEHTRK